MKRFKYDERQNTMRKLNYKIAFPLELKLAPNYEENSPRQRFILRAIIAHIGSGSQYGHYFCVLKNKGKWYKFDDQDISIVEERELSSIFGN